MHVDPANAPSLPRVGSRAPHIPFDLIRLAPATGARASQPSPLRLVGVPYSDEQNVLFGHRAEARYGLRRRPPAVSDGGGKYSPSRKPLVVVSGVLNSGGRRTNQMTPISSEPSVEIVPGVVLLSPESTSGKSPYSAASRTRLVSSNATETSA